MKIYCAHPMTGLTMEHVKNYYKTIVLCLNPAFEVLHPMIAKGEILNETEKFSPRGEITSPITTAQAIKARDRWMVQQSDMLLIDLIGAKEKSIGCIGEIAWADAFGKYIVLCMEKGNIHEHAFIIAMAGARFQTLNDGLTYLNKLANKEI